MSTQKITVTNTGTAVGDGTKAIVIDPTQGRLLAAFTDVDVASAPASDLFRPLEDRNGWYTFDCAGLNQKLWVACAYYATQEIVYTEGA